MLRPALLLQVNNLLFWFVLELSRPTLAFSLAARIESSATMGALLAFQSLLPLFLAIPAGLAGDRLGPRRLLPLGSVLLIGSGATYLLADQTAAGGSYLLLVLAAQLLNGVAWLLVWIATQSLVSSEPAGSGEDYTRRRVNLLALTASLGALAGPLTAGMLYPLGGATMVWTAFLILVGCHLVFSIAIYRMLPLTAADRQDERSSAPADGPVGHGWRDLGGGLYLFVLLASLVLFIGSEFRGTYMPAYLAQRGADPGSIGLALTIGAAGVGIVRLLVSIQALRLPPRLTVALALGMAVSGIALLPWLQDGGTAALALISLLLAVGVGVGEPLLIYTILRAARPLKRSLALAGRLTANRAAMLLSPLAAGYAVQTLGATRGLIAMSTAMAVLALAACWLFWRHAPGRISSH